MRKGARALLAMLLALTMTVGAAAPAAAAEGATSPETAAGVPDGARSGAQPLRELIDSQFKGAAVRYAPDDIVTVVVELEDRPLTDMKAIGEGAAAVSAVGRASALMKIRQQAVKTRLKTAEPSLDFDNSVSYTTLLNAFTVRAPYGKLSAIASAEGVKRAFVSGSFSVPVTEPEYTTYTEYSSDMMGVPAAAESGYTGKGMVIAVLDTGIEYTHEAFGQIPEGGRWTEESMKAFVDEHQSELSASMYDGYDYDLGESIYRAPTGDEVWHSGKIVYSFDYADNDADATAEGSSHGVHVSGIAAGNNGSDFHGVAPDAQLVAMKVFSNSGSCETTTLLSALEDCVLLGVDVINMSLGTASGFSTDVTEVLGEIMQRLEDAGIVVVAAAGNDAHTASNNPLSEAKLPPISGPDFGLAASPSTYEAAFSVASVENSVFRFAYMMLNDRRIDFSDPNEGALSLAGQYDELELVAVPGYGAYEDYNGIDVAGKAALISRGGGEEMTFAEKARNAYFNDAAAVVIYDNEESDELIMMDLDGFTAMPAIFISKEDGDWAVEMLNSGEKVVLKSSKEYVDSEPNEGAGLMSVYSAWGPTSTMEIKPEISAPGGGIYSSLTGNTYASYSGTSMASPQIAGVSALLLQYAEENGFGENAKERCGFVRALMMSTASQVKAENGLPASVRQQGAGLVDVEAAINAAAILLSADGGKPKASVGDSEDGKYSFSFKVKNLGDEPKQYGMTVSAETDTAVEIDGRSFFSGVPQDLTGDVTVTFESDTLFLPGDVNKDGTVDSADARLILRHLNGSGTLEGEALALADVNLDGSVTEEDMSAALRQDAWLDEASAPTVTVPAGETVDVTVTLELSASKAEALMEEFPNGTCIDGFVTLSCAGEKLSMPYLGFLGDWDGMDAFDATAYDGTEANVYPASLVAIYYAQYGDERSMEGGNYLGWNYFTQSFRPDRMYFGPHSHDMDDGWGTEYHTALYSEISALRNLESTTYTAAEGDRVIYSTDGGPAFRTYFDTSAEGYIMGFDPTYLLCEDLGALEWPENGETFTYTVTAVPEGGGSEQTLVFPEVTIDDEKPTVTADTVYNPENGHFELHLTLSDNEYLQGARLSAYPYNDYGYRGEAEEFGVVGGEELEQVERGGSYTEIIDVTELQKALLEGGFFADGIYIEAVDYAWNITDIEVAFEGEHFDVEEKEDGTLRITGFAGMSLTQTVPDTIDGKTVTEIGEGAFAGSAFTSVELPDTVTVIGDEAFMGCSMTEVYVPGSVVEIGEKAFGYDADGEAIEGFTIMTEPDSAAETYGKENGFDVRYLVEGGLILAIENGEAQVTGYRGESGDVVIPDTFHDIPITSIAPRLFYQNWEITSVTFPDTLKTIGERAFMYTGLSGDLELPESVTVIEEGAFANTNISSVNIPAGVKDIPYMTFYGIWALETVTFAEGLESIGDDAFRDCGSLTGVKLPDSLKEIGQCSFYGCYGLDSIEIPGSVKLVGDGAFEDSGLRNLTLNEGTETIGALAFSMSGVTSVTIPASVTSIGMAAFEQCYGLETLTFADDGSNKPLTIEMAAFGECGITSVSIPGRCTTIEVEAFRDCTGLSDITLGEGITTIGSGAFFNTAATKVTVPASVIEIGDRALGYDSYNEVDPAIEGFVIAGYAGTEAERYAKANSITFETLG